MRKMNDAERKWLLDRVVEIIWLHPDIPLEHLQFIQGITLRITSYNVCYTKLLRARKLLGAVALGLITTVASAAYPERDITGTIMWGAGGAMDVVSRAVQPHAEAVLGKKIVIINKPSGTGITSYNLV